MTDQIIDNTFNSKYRYIIVGSILLNMALTYASSQLTSPLLTVISEEMGVDISSAGILSTGAMLMLGLTMVFGGSSFSQKFSSKYTAILGYFICILGNIIVFFSDNFTLIFIGRLLAGAGIGFEMSSCVHYVSTWVEPKKRPLVFTLITIASVGSVFLAFLAAVPLSDALGSWHAPFGLLAALEALGLVIWIFAGRDNPDFAVPENPSLKHQNMAIAVLKRKDMWILAGFYAFVCICGSAMMTYLPAYFETVSGFSSSTASGITGFTQLASVCGSLVISAIAAKTGMRKTICIVASAASAVLILIFVNVHAVILSLAAAMLFSMLSGVFAPIVQTMTTEIKGATPALSTAAYSFVLGMSALFSFLPPFIMSLLTNVIGLGFQSCFLVFAAFFGLAFIFSLFISEAGKK